MGAILNAFSALEREISFHMLKKSHIPVLSWGSLMLSKKTARLTSYR